MGITDIRYHPLIGEDTKRNEKVPMFVTNDRDKVENVSSMYLLEMIPNYFRLCSKEPVNQKDNDKFHIHCPICGSNLMQISLAYDTTRLGLYTCDRCRSLKKED